jgi:hypothetical protein
MIRILSRRLRVRDDGTGKGRETDGTLAEFETEDAIILLGDPGMGKTTFFRDAAKTNYTTVRNFLIDSHATAGEALFLDALDEYRTIACGQDASAEVAKALCALKRPKFRLSCRAADWFGSLDQEVLRTASASGRIVVLELCPLSRDEILDAVQGVIPDPVVFLDEAESAGLGELLGNPQTLDLIARAWRTDKKPRNKFEAYAIGVSGLLKEINPQHVTRGMTSVDPRDLRDAAGAAFTTLLLSNSVGISRAEPADGDGYVKLPVIPHPNRNDLDAVLKRRLFISPEVDRFEPIHRTIAEFLAAEDLSRRITNGLPIDRGMALICGIDGRPVSSLRGLFAWLMCGLGNLAEGYVERDPYGVVTYGDASVLPPDAQCAIWTGLRKLHDPWFLTNEDDRGSFRNLANLNTAHIIHTLLHDPATGAHLKIAVLEAIANSTENIGLNATLRDMVLEKHDNTWLRSTALRAFAQSVQNDWGPLEALDDELAQATDDLDAPKVRVELLRLTPAFGNLALRVLSILEQATSAKKERGVFGGFYSLIALPSDADLDVILDGASRVLRPESRDGFELQSLFEEWLKRRLVSPAPITPMQLTSWLRNMRGSHDRNPEKTLTSLKARFEQEPSLFEKVFERLATAVPNDDRSFRLFTLRDLWQLLPVTAWPFPPSEFFLACAEKETDSQRAADLFRMYLAQFPMEGASVALAEAGFTFLDRRHDVAKALGNWKSCKIEKWQKDTWKRREKEGRKRAINRARNVAYFTPRLTTIRAGGEEHGLAWAARVYQGLFYEVHNIPDARQRLVSVTNDEIADALLEGFIRYTEHPTVPTKETVIESWLANSIPYTHTLLSLSVFLRIKVGMTVPEESLPHCLAAVVTNFHIGDKVPGHDEKLSEWLLQKTRQNPALVRSVLKEIWVSSAAVKRGSLPGFYELSHDPGSEQFLASLSADVLRAGINEDHDTVGELVSVLLRHGQRAAVAIGETELARNELSAEVWAIWITALFVIDPSKYLEPWKALMSGPDALMWEAIEIIGGGRHEKREAVRLTSAQRTEVITSVGQRFPNVGYPTGGSMGSRNPWDASEFIASQIKLLSADSSPDVGDQLERLENDGGLSSYRDLIRHQKAQHEKQQRESSFTFGSPEEVAEAIRNHAPATPSDLLAFVVDHLSVLAGEVARTQRERYRAYWNERGRNLIKPKREEVCSGLLAEDLQNRVQPHSLIVTVEHHMVKDKECDLVVLQETERLLPIEVKHHYHAELWTAWHTQLDHLYTRDAKAGGLGIYLVLWSGEAKGQMMPKLPNGLTRPTSATELRAALESLIPQGDRHRLRIVVVDISGK